MNEDYGVFANVVAIAGCLAAAAGAMGIAWMKRAKWQPPEEEVPGATGKFAALFSMVIIAILYVFGAEWFGSSGLAALALIAFGLAVIFLCIAIFVGSSRSFEVRGSKKKRRVLGGLKLTPEAERIRAEHGLSEQQMFDDAQWEKDLVWTKSSQALVLVLSTVAFIGLIASGTTAVAAASNLVAVAMSGESTVP
jgi:hypothetical protein